MLLKGDVGAGKTTFSRSIIHTLGNADEEVVSPTFTLVQPYSVQLSDGQQLLLHHFDLYRLEDADELEALGVEELFSSGIALVEWPEIAAGIVPQDALILRFEAGSVEDARRVFVEAPQSWQPRVEQWIDAYRESKTAA